MAATPKPVRKFTKAVMSEKRHEEKLSSKLSNIEKHHPSYVKKHIEETIKKEHVPTKQHKEKKLHSTEKMLHKVHTESPQHMKGVKIKVKHSKEDMHKAVKHMKKHGG